MVFLPAAVYAQTAEENVVYFTSGFEGKEVEMPSSPTSKYPAFMKPLENGNAGFSVYLKLPNGSQVKVFTNEFVKIDDCKYKEKMSFERNNAGGLNSEDKAILITLNFQSADAIRVSDDRTHKVSISNLSFTCSPFGKITCSDLGAHSDFGMVWANVGDKQRIQQAFAHFKSVFCKT